MLKKILYINVLLLALFCFDFVDAYEYKDPNNESKVEDKITEIYDVKEQYEDLAGELYIEEVEIQETSSDYYWWPIGSAEVEESGGKKYATGNPETVNMTSPYGYRSDPFGSGKRAFHSGQDIAGGRGLGKVNIIASKDGTVVYSGKNKSQCSSSNACENCHGGYGNYVIIQHTDGNYTLYAHLYANSILVDEGESVSQGQVIASMGSSGCSTGAHLHFEVREGQNAYSAAVNPLNYIDPSNPRPANAGGDLMAFIEYWEGKTPVVGDSYKVVNIGDGVRTVGKGVTLEHNAARFKAHGIDVSKYPVGSTIPISICDQIENEIISEMKSSVESTLAKNNLTLKQNQVDALVSFKYNIGNINKFPAAYKEYGDTEALYENFFSKYVHSNGKVWKGLVRRRKAEWDLFHNGNYIVK